MWTFDDGQVPAAFAALDDHLRQAGQHLPILGDQNYGNFRLNREFARKLGTDRLFLHARSVSVDLTIAGTRVRFVAESPLPVEFQRMTGR